MGCDGGTIPKRDELVKVKKRPEQKDKASELSFKWCHCSITQQKLEVPIVACMLGRLYSKDSVIEALLDRSKMPEHAAHIKSLKDIKDLALTVNPAFTTGAETGDGYIDRQTAQYICPTTGIEMNGKFKFCFVWKCGCVVSERALKEVRDNICHKCQTAYSEGDIVILNPEQSDLDLMRVRMDARVARMKAEKKAKKGSKTVSTETESKSTSNGVHSTEEPSTSGCSSSSSGEVKPTVDLKPKKDEAGSSKRKNKIVPTGAKEIEDPAFKKSKSTYSVAKDDNASSVYKSLFTSSDKAKSQTRAHWITYNPFYN
ncbi:protein RTF2 homolog [Diaphorina citri]|uniref:Replication termination factor 2 n=1 Tax=Diaphorina citri TaxID=121845 RepID=A0A1S3D368_DIACI|nr:protein RTF2 homolog [Diaphorina citri]XP_017299742.1 protein RTF2 homolog [Diaphorina citri]XP_026679722.1 protein RTF2 homolog [Diaphorina citri]